MIVVCIVVTVMHVHKNGHVRMSELLLVAARIINGTPQFKKYFVRTRQHSLHRHDEKTNHKIPQIHKFGIMLLSRQFHHWSCILEEVLLENK